MSLFTHVLWVISYLIIATFVAVSLNRAMALDILTSGSIGAILFLLMVQVHAIISRRQERRDMQRRLMALYRDYQSALDAVEQSRADMKAVTDAMSRLERDQKAGVKSEMKVMKVLLAQIAEKSMVRDTVDNASEVKSEPVRNAAIETSEAAASPVDENKGSGAGADKKSAVKGDVAPGMDDVQDAASNAAPSPPPAEDQSSYNYQSLSHGALRDEPERADNDDSHISSSGMLASARDEILNIMHNALEENRVDLYLQPVVGLPSRRVCHYEAFSRVRDVSGHIIFPREYLPIAEEAGLSGTLDNLLLFRCIQTIRRLGPRRPGIKFFCNISPASLEDDEFFPQFVDFMVNNPDLAERMVFEFSERDIERHSDDVIHRLDLMGQNGFSFSMDQISNTRFHIPLLSERHVRYVKLEPEVFLSPNNDIHPEDLGEALKRHDVELIVEKIEDEKTVLEVLDHNVQFGQGYLFGEPRLSKESGPAEKKAV